MVSKFQEMDCIYIIVIMNLQEILVHFVYSLVSQNNKENAATGVHLL